jgi:hypothetical protein
LAVLGEPKGILFCFLGEGVFKEGGGVFKEALVAIPTGGESSSDESPDVFHTKVKHFST